jgi:hypothetical protein
MSITVQKAHRLDFANIQEGPCHCDVQAPIQPQLLLFHGI